MARALELAQLAEQQEEVPVGAVLVYQGEAIGEGWNQPIASKDPTSHAEINALRQASQNTQNYRLVDTTLYVTLEPCAMCLGAMLQARVKRLVFGAYDPRAGAVKSVFNLLEERRVNHCIDWQGGILEDECAEVLKAFFRARRGKACSTSSMNTA